VIVFIQIEHDFLDTKFATYWGTYKTVGFGWLRCHLFTNLDFYGILNTLSAWAENHRL